MDPAVLERIGHPGNAGRAVQPDLYPDYIEAGLLDHLLDGSWREARRALATPVHATVEST
jgi:hypothetical protein